MISVVIPIYNEEDTIIPLHTAIRDTMTDLGEAWEVVYVNDGSTDCSMSLLLMQQADDPHIVIVELSRNWGHQGAITAGLKVARGDAVVTMDGDLQDPPAVIADLVAAWQQGAQVVLADRRSRCERSIKYYLYPIFYKLLGTLADYPIPLNSGIFGLMDRKVVDAINALPENNRYIPGLKAFVGFRTTSILYDRHDRHAGIPKYTWRKLFRYAFDAIFSFSYKPLRASFAAGGLCLALSLALGISLALSTLAGSSHTVLSPVVGSILSGLLFVGGLQLFCIGIFGEYVGRIYDEVRHRPLYLIQQVHRAGAHAQAHVRIAAVPSNVAVMPSLEQQKVVAVEAEPKVIMPLPASA